MIDFYLTSTELRKPYKPRACKILRRLKSEVRDDFALVSIDPPISQEIYKTNEDINEILLASKHKGSSLFPLSKLPIAVYICILQEPIDNNIEKINSKNIKIIDWGEIIAGT